MCTQHSRTLILMSIALVIALLANGAVQGKKGGGGKGGGGGGGGEEAAFAITELPTLGDAGDPDDISNPSESGAVFIVGTCFNPAERFLWHVNTTGEIVGTTTLPFRGLGVNSNAVVVGRWVGTLEENGPTVSIATAWQEDNFYWGLPLLAGGIENEARDVNNNSEVVGREYDIDPDTGEEIATGVYWRLRADGTVADAFVFDDFLPLSISDSGFAAGRIGLDSPVPAIADLNVDPPAITILDALPNAVEGYGIDVNNHGEATGHQTVVGRRGSTYFHAFFSGSNGTVDLGSLKRNGSARGWSINDPGLVVGEADAGSGRRAYLWDGAEMMDLNEMIDSSSGVVVLESAWGINSVNQIICRGWDADGRSRTYLLTPLE